VRGISLWQVHGKDRPHRQAAARSRKQPWLVAVLEANDGRLATGATMEPAATKRGSAGREMLVEGRVVWRPRRRDELMASRAALSRCSTLLLPPGLGNRGGPGLPPCWRTWGGPPDIERKKKREIENK
jgi:hypothetical protein